MQFQYDMTAQTAPPPIAPPAPETPTELLRQIRDQQRDFLAQMLEVQQQQLGHARAMAQDATARWRNILGRWQQDLPQLTGHCREAYPILERVYIHMLSGMVEELTQQGEEGYETDFALQDFLDRYGMRMGQLGHLVHVLGPIAEAAHQNDAAARDAAAREEKQG